MFSPTSKQRNECLVHGYIRNYASSEIAIQIPLELKQLLMILLQYMMDQWDIKHISDKINLIQSDDIYKCYEYVELRSKFEDWGDKIYGTLTVSTDSQCIVSWKLRIVNLKYKSIGCYAKIGIINNNDRFLWYAGYSGRTFAHRPMFNRQMNGPKIFENDIFEVICDAKLQQIRFKINNKDIKFSRDEQICQEYAKLPQGVYKLCVQLKYPETKIQLFDVCKY